MKSKNASCFPVIQTLTFVIALIFASVAYAQILAPNSTQLSDGVVFEKDQLQVKRINGGEWYQAKTLPPPGGSVTRDQDAMALLRNILAASGGVASPQSKSVVVIGSLEHQSKGGKDVQTGTFRWVDSFVGKKHSFRREQSLGTHKQIFTSSEGAPKHAMDDKVSDLVAHFRHVGQLIYLPQMFLSAALTDDSISIQLLSSSDPALIHLRISDSSDLISAALTPTDWFFDAQTLAPRRVMYRVPHQGNALIFTVSTLEFQDFNRVNGILVPVTMLALGRGGATTRLHVSSVDLNAVGDPSDFILGTGSAQ